MRNPVKSFNKTNPKTPVNGSGRRRIVSWITRIIIAILIFYLSALAAIYLYLQRDPQSLVDQYLGKVSEKTGLTFSIGSVEVTLVPLPALAVSNVRIIGPGLQFTAAWCQMAPAASRIFSGNFLPGTLTVLRPRLNLRTTINLTQPEELLKLINGDKDSSNLTLPDMSMEIMDFGMDIKGSANTSLTLSGLDAIIDSWSDGRIKGLVRFTRMTALRDNRQLLSLRKFTISGASDLNKILEATPGISLAGHVNWQDVIARSAIEAGFSADSHGLHANGKIRGKFDCGGEDVPFFIRGAMESAHPLILVESNNLEWRIGPDSGNLSFKWNRDKAGQSLEGTFMANRLGLPEWLGFARNLPPGIQLAMDNITSARADFKITPKGLAVPRIRAYCSGSIFTGSGGVPDWSKPSVNLDLVSPLVNLGLALPESVGEQPDSPFYTHPPLTPLPGKPLKPGETGIDYDINLSAVALLYGPVTINNASVRIHPGKLDVTGLQDVLLDGKGNIYGGALKGQCILGADPSLPYHINASVKNMNGMPFGKALPAQPIRQGTYSASATITSRGKTLNGFLNNLRGDWQISAQNARLSASSLVFNPLVANGKIRTGAWHDKRLTIDGQWNTNLKNSDWNAICELNGKLSFGKNGLAWTNAPLTLRASFNTNGPLPKGTEVHITGTSSGQTGENTYKLEKARLNLAGISAQGNFTADGGRESVKGHMSARINDPDQTLRTLGFTSADMPQDLKPVIAEADFEATPSSAILSGLKASLGTHQLAGDMAWEMKNNRPFYKLNLSMGTTSLADHLKGSKTGQNWNYPFMSGFDAEGTLKFKELNIFDVRFRNLQAPFRLKAGKLEIDPLTANFYSAPLRAAAMLDFSRGIRFAVSTAANAFDLGAAVRDRKTEVAITGLASLEARLNGHLVNKAKIVDALNGTWNLSINNGSWQPLKKNGETDGKPTSFSRASASGKIQAGIIRSSNFVLNSPDMKLTGGGWYNLSTNKMDCTFNVNMKNLPDFPIYVYGPVSNLQKRIDAGKMIVNAVGGMASGFVNAIGGALKGAWNIFSN